MCLSSVYLNTSFVSNESAGFEEKNGVLTDIARFGQLRKIRKKQVRRYWIRDIFRNREEFDVLFEELKQDRRYFLHFMRMALERFDHLLSLVRPKIEKQDKKFRKAIKF